MPAAIAFDFEMVTEKLKRHKSAGMDQTTAELFKAVHSEIHTLINLILSGIRGNWD